MASNPLNEISLKIEGFKELADKLKSLTGMPRLVMIPIIAKYALKIQKDARKAVAVDTGITRASILTAFTGQGLTAEVGSAQKAALWQEFGTKPHIPPGPALLPWVQRHGLVPKKGQTQLDIAWAIARAIGRKGTKARPFLGPAFEESAPKYVAEANDELRKNFDL